MNWLPDTLGKIINTASSVKTKFAQIIMHNKPKNPTDYPVDQLARFWNTHDLTEFEDQLDEVTEPVFEAQDQGNPYASESPNREPDQAEPIDEA
jgi:hypothetical protein